jgi:hypothetical protein
MNSLPWTLSLNAYDKPKLTMGASILMRSDTSNARLEKRHRPREAAVPAMRWKLSQELSQEDVRRIKTEIINHLQFRSYTLQG